MNMNFTLTEQELDLAIASLAEMPAKISYNLLTKLAKVKADAIARRDAPVENSYKEGLVGIEDR